MSLKPTTSFLFQDPTYRSLSAYPEDALRKEYARMRKVANKRVERLEKYKDKLDIPEAYLQDFKAGSELSERDLKFAIMDVQSFLENPYTTVKERKRITRERREYFKDEYGLNFKNLDEYKAFFKYLEYLKAVNGESFDYAFDEMQETYKKANERTRRTARSLKRYMNKHRGEFTHAKPTGQFL